MTTDLIVLAAGKGTRLNADRPKPLVELAGEPLIGPILRHGYTLPFSRVLIAISRYTAEIASRFTGGRITCVMTEPRGTGAAVSDCLEVSTAGRVVIAQADDSFFYSEATVRRISQAAGDFVAGTVEVEGALPYGWVELRDGRLTALHRSPEKLWETARRPLVCGLYAADAAWLRKALLSVKPNQAGEIPLPQVIEDGVRRGADVRGFEVPGPEWLGVNTPAELDAARRKVLEI